MMKKLYKVIHFIHAKNAATLEQCGFQRVIYNLYNFPTKTKKRSKIALDLYLFIYYISYTYNFLL